MKTGIVIAALAAALITGSAVSSQAIPAAPLSKGIQQNSSSLVEHVGYRGYRGYRRVGLYRGYRRVGLYRGYRRVGLYRAACRPLPASRLLRIQRLSACRLIPGLPRLSLGRSCPVSQPRLLVKPPRGSSDVEISYGS